MGGKLGHENAKTPPLVTPPQENPKPKTETQTENFFFDSELIDLLNPQRVWTPLKLQQVASYNQKRTHQSIGFCGR